MRRATASAALALAAALAVAAGGCGSAGSGGTTASAAPSVAGRVLFTGACGACHTLTGHDTPSRQGGDLLGVQLHRAVALQFAREMPVRRTLTEAQLGTIVDYIAAVQRGNR